MLILQFIIGLGVGLYGYLTPGYINLGIMQLSMRSEKRSVAQALWIITIVEIPYCILCMSGMQWLMQQEILLLIIRWTIVGVLLLMVGLTIHDARKPAKEKNFEKEVDKAFIRKLLFFAVFNPFQLSAWTIWGSFFIEKDWFDWSLLSIVIFSIGAAIGVFIMLKLYIVMGQKLVKFFKLQHRAIGYGVAAILLILALVQIFNNLRHM